MGASRDVLVLVLGGVAAACLAGCLLVGRALVREIAILRRAATEPRVCVYVAHGQWAPFLLDLVIKNCGRGDAWSTRCTVSAEDTERLRRGGVNPTLLDVFERSALFLAPGEERRFYLGDAREFTADPPLEGFDLSVQFQRDAGETIRRRFHISPAEQGRCSRMGDPPDVETAQVLKALSRDIHSVITRSQCVRVAMEARDARSQRGAAGAGVREDPRGQGESTVRGESVGDAGP